ncbi:MAG: ABC transporter ATP-binding protein [Thermoanaerobaculia bacterium]|nr:ABC transporter ATP-binding protein [Thermoanaerobaculia bacterium]
MPEGAVLAVRGARKSFGATRALDGVDLELRAGEWLGLLGPNGAGKTTLLRAVCGLTDLDGGEIAVGDGSLGLVPQEVALYPALTARENLSVFGRLHGLPRPRLAERIDWALDWTGLARRAAEPVAGFSGGMRRRLNIACGVLHRPAVVLLDEPTVGVDPQGRGRIWEMLEELRRGGAALVQSSHHLDEVQTRCDRMVVLDRGRIIADGTLDQLARHTRIGSRVLRLELDGDPDGLALPRGLAVSGRTLTGYLTDVPAQLAALLERLAAAELGVADIHVEAPRLEEIFTQLTGRELRE